MTVTDSNARSRVRAPLRSLLQRKLVCIKSGDQSFLAVRTRRATAPAVFALLGAFGCGITVAAETPADAMAWLKKIAAASRQLNYAGTFVYQHGRQMESSRIAHMADANGEYEKLETLDGPPREIIRNNENVTCYVPDNKTVIIEKRTARQFPALLPEQLTGITDNYVVTKGGQDRVAGYDCQVVVLEPRDNLRYGHKFCVELATGLPLRARIYNDKNEMVESFARDHSSNCSAVKCSSVLNTVSTMTCRCDVIRRFFSARNSMNFCLAHCFSASGME